MSNFTFFFGTSDPEKPFSQWYPSIFEDETGTEYNCAEQYMMAQKAKMFKDFQTYDKIILTKSPKDQKMLGRAVQNFNKKMWDVVSNVVVYNGSILKYKQNVVLRNKLIATGDTLLVEASPFDTIWGIGLSEVNPLITDIDKWRGENRLGYILTQVREELK